MAFFKAGEQRGELSRENAGGPWWTPRAFYFAFGEDDAYLTLDLPDNATAATICWP
jgi:hypothetical protein